MAKGRFFVVVATMTAFAAFAAEQNAPGQIPQDRVPVPETRPDSAPATAPIPEEKPKDRQPDAADKPAGGAQSPDTAKPEDKPKEPAEATEPTPPAAEKPGQTKDAPESKGDAKEAPTPEEAKDEPPEKEDPEAYAACLSRLKDAGVEFSETKTIDDSNGCGIEKPLAVRTILPGVKLEPEATMRCQTAEALSRWTKTTVMPAADIAFGPNAPQITRVNQATSYACRNRNNAETGKISEHAHGNAIDIAGFTFADGKTFTIEPREKDSTLTGAFERAITASACLFFTTVLGPGSDAAHETHLHLDVMKRKGDYRYCW